MTKNEAIKNLKDILGECTESEKAVCYVTSVDAPALGMAINALEKQIPKKPEYEAGGYADGELVYDYAKCPICGHDFEYGINDWGCEHCSNCGQKLDWSDEE